MIVQIVLQQKTHLSVCDVVNHSQTSCLKSDLPCIRDNYCIREDKTQEQILMRTLFIVPLLCSAVLVLMAWGWNVISLLPGSDLPPLYARRRQWRGSGRTLNGRMGHMTTMGLRCCSSSFIHPAETMMTYTLLVSTVSQFQALQKSKTCNPGPRH